MGLFHVRVVARNPKDEAHQTAPVEVLVNTGSELTWLPADALRAAGFVPRYRAAFHTATNQTVERDVGYAILAAEGFETNDEVVFAEASDLHLLGVRTVEGFGVAIDPVARRFIPRPRLVA